LRALFEICTTTAGLHVNVTFVSELWSPLVNLGLLVVVTCLIHTGHLGNHQAFVGKMKMNVSLTIFTRNASSNYCTPFDVQYVSPPCAPCTEDAGDLFTEEDDNEDRISQQTINRSMACKKFMEHYYVDFFKCIELRLQRYFLRVSKCTSTFLFVQERETGKATR
jgi:hypothetical protein